MTVALLAIAALASCGMAVLGGRVALSRRRVLQDPAVFRCTVRVLRGPVPGLRSRKPWRPCRAQWSHDVLLLRLGASLGWALPLPVRVAEDRLESAGKAAEQHLGPEAVQLRLRLDDDAMVVVAAPAADAELLSGPFLAIAARGSPPGIGTPGPRRSS